MTYVPLVQRCRLRHVPRTTQPTPIKSRVLWTESSEFPSSWKSRPVAFINSSHSIRVPHDTGVQRSGVAKVGSEHRWSGRKYLSADRFLAAITSVGCLPKDETQESSGSGTSLYLSTPTCICAWTRALEVTSFSAPLVTKSCHITVEMATNDAKQVAIGHQEYGGSFDRDSDREKAAVPSAYHDDEDAVVTMKTWAVVAVSTYASILDEDRTSD